MLFRSLQRTQDRLFLDAANGGYHTSVASPDLLVRMKEDGDNVIPSANATAVRNGLKLATLTGDRDFRAAADSTLRFFGPALRSRPYTLARLVPALAWAEGRIREIVITGEPSLESTRSLVAALRRSSLRDAVVVLGGSDVHLQELAALIPSLRSFPKTGESSFGYVCRDFTCQAPSSDYASFLRALSV